MIVADTIQVKPLSEKYVYVAVKQTLWTRYSFSSETRVAPENGSK